MSKTAEGKVKDEIVKYLNKNKIFHFRMNASGEMAGAPDLLAIYKGYAVGIEVKKPGGRATELQKRILKNFKYGGVFDNVEDVKMLLMEITLNG